MCGCVNRKSEREHYVTMFTWPLPRVRSPSKIGASHAEPRDFQPWDSRARECTGERIDHAEVQSEQYCF